MTSRGSELYGRSHKGKTTSEHDSLRSAEGKQLKLLEAILDRVSQLVRERLQPFLRPTVVEAGGANAAEDGLHRVQAGRLVAGHAPRGAAKLARNLLLAVRAQPVAQS